MPRLTNKEYLDRCHWLRLVWLDPHKTPLVVLTPNEQWDIHRYFQPSKELTATELLEHRKQEVKEQPNLPARAGKAFTKMIRAIDSAHKRANGDPELTIQYIHDSVPQAAIPDKLNRKVRVFALAKPEPDLRMLAKTLVEMARQEQIAEESKAA